MGDTTNPWFNHEIASLVKEHRKAMRKYYRSKTNKKELKQICKSLDKKKRKLIKASKQKYLKRHSHRKHEATQKHSGYIAFYMVQLIGIIWKQWGSGKYYVDDVDDILESIDITEDHQEICLFFLFKWCSNIKNEFGAGKYYTIDIAHILGIKVSNY